MGVASKAASALSALRGKGALGIASGMFLTRAAAFLGSVVLVRVLSKQDYGALSSLENIYTYIYLLAGFGLNNAVFRWLVLKEDPGERKGVFLHVLSAGTLVNVSLVVLAALADALVPLGGAGRTVPWMLVVMLLAVPFQYAFETGTFSLRALFMNREFAVASVCAVLLVWGLKIVLAVTLGLEGAVFSWPIAYAMASAVLLAVLLMGVFKDVRSVSVPRGERREMLSYSLQYMVTNGMWSLFMQNDILMVGQITGSLEAVADYKAACLFPTVLSLLAGSAGMFVAPYFVRREEDRSWVWRNYKRALAIVAGVVGVASLAMGLLAEPLAVLVYGERYAGIAPLALVLLVGAFFNSGIRYTAANLIAAMGRIRANMIVSAAGIVVQVMLNLVLIPWFGVYGAAYAGIVVQLLMAAAITAYFVRTYRPRSR